MFMNVCDVPHVWQPCSTPTGDGTLLWTCHMFGNRAVPPILPFNMGSLGFLTPFPPDALDPMLQVVLEGAWVAGGHGW